MVILVNGKFGKSRVREYARNRYIYIINNKYIFIYLFTVLPLLVIPQANLQITKITIYFFYPPQIFHILSGICEDLKRIKNEVVAICDHLIC